MRKVHNLVTRKVGVLIGFSEVPHAQERIEKIEKFLVDSMDFAKKDVHVYSDLSRKNIMRVMDDLQPVLESKS